MPWVYRFIVMVLILWGGITAIDHVTSTKPEAKPEKMHFVYGDLFTILDSKKGAWFYGE